MWTVGAEQSPSTVVPTLAFVLCLSPDPSLGFTTFLCAPGILPPPPPHPQAQPLLAGLADPLSSESSLG